MCEKNISRRSFLTISALSAAAFVINWPKINARAEKIKNKKEFPVVIIGAGLGGLCCGAYLAKSGFPVTVVEQHVIPPAGMPLPLTGGTLPLRFLSTPHPFIIMRLPIYSRNSASSIH